MFFSIFISFQSGKNRCRSGRSRVCHGHDDLRCAEQRNSLHLWPALDWCRSRIVECHVLLQVVRPVGEIQEDSHGHPNSLNARDVHQSRWLLDLEPRKLREGNKREFFLEFNDFPTHSSCTPRSTTTTTWSTTWHSLEGGKCSVSAVKWRIATKLNAAVSINDLKYSCQSMLTF